MRRGLEPHHIVLDHACLRASSLGKSRVREPRVMHNDLKAPNLVKDGDSRQSD